MSVEKQDLACYSRAEMAAVIAAVCIGEGGLVTMPYIVGGIADRFAVSAGISGLISTAQFTAMALIAVTLTATIHRVDRRKLAFAAVALTLAGHVVGAASAHWPLFVASRIAVGLGEGALLTLGTAAAAGTPTPQRTFSLVTFAFVVMAGAIFLTMPLLAGRYGPSAIFYVLVVVGLVGAPWLLHMPNLRVKAPRDRHSGSSVWRPFPWILLAIACQYMGVNTLWAFSERIAVAIGIGPKAIGHAFLIMVVLACSGPILAAISQRKWGYRRTIALGVLLQALSCWALGGASFYLMFVVALVALNVAHLTLVPTYRALTALIDPAGRIAAASIAVQTTAGALGPFIASLVLLAGGGYMSVGVYGGVLVLIAWLLVAGVARRADDKTL